MRTLFLLLVSASLIGACNAVLGIDEPNVVYDDGGDPSSSKDSGRPKADSGTEPDEDGGTEPSDGGAKADSSKTDAALPLTPIPTLRNPNASGRPAFNTDVRVQGVVTGTKTAGDTSHGFFLREPTATQWGGIFVFLGQNDVPVATGDLVVAQGKFIEYRGFEEINAATVTKVGTAAVPSPLVVAITDINQSGGHAMERQSMLVRVENVIATTTTIDGGVLFTVKKNGGGPETLTITSFMANADDPSPFPAAFNQTYTSITGHGYCFGTSTANTNHMLAPRAVSDVVTP